MLVLSSLVLVKIERNQVNHVSIHIESYNSFCILNTFKRTMLIGVTSPLGMFTSRQSPFDNPLSSLFLLTLGYARV